MFTFTVTCDNPNTIFNKLKAKLGREPTNAECKAEVIRILDNAKTERVSKKR